ncbi:VOC family protein [Subtercola sp. YIM 133946]|uniref:VOC family protein n=1 Tax=Subtercola sp. YIM 133946 TaxID=3118909 RepID=UPI002F939AE6
MAILNPYLNFRDTARQALDYYQTVFGGEITRSTFGEFGVSEDPAETDKVMHSQLTTPSGFTIMAADTPNSMEYNPGNNISVSLSGPKDDYDELAGYYARLSGDGTVTVPLNTAPWGDSFGMCVDSFGIAWLVNVSGQPAA